MKVCGSTVKLQLILAVLSTVEMCIRDRDDYSYPYHKDGDGSNSYKSTVTNKVQKKVDARR